MDQTLIELNQKIDALSTQVAFLAEEARLQRRNRQEWDELKSDLIPVANEVYQVSVRQLDEIESYVRLEDILRVSKRLVRNTRNVEAALDQLESLSDLAKEVGPLTDEIFLTLMTRLSEMESKGYFSFMQGGMAIMDEIVTNFSEEDIRQLGENIVLILQTVKEMTQPEIMTLLRSSATAMRDEELPGKVTILDLVRQLNDPDVRRGLSSILNVLKSISDSNHGSKVYN